MKLNAASSVAQAATGNVVTGLFRSRLRSRFEVDSEFSDIVISEMRMCLSLAVSRSVVTGMGAFKREIEYILYRQELLVKVLSSYLESGQDDISSIKGYYAPLFEPPEIEDMRIDSILDVLRMPEGKNAPVFVTGYRLSVPEKLVMNKWRASFQSIERFCTLIGLGV